MMRLPAKGGGHASTSASSATNAAIGAINAAACAASPTTEGAKHLSTWDALAEDGVLDGPLIR
jgi:hypothetical protein